MGPVEQEPIHETVGFAEQELSHYIDLNNSMAIELERLHRDQIIQTKTAEAARANLARSFMDLAKSAMVLKQHKEMQK